MNDARVMTWRTVWHSIRGPLCWLALGWWWAHSPLLRAQLVWWQSRPNLFHAWFCAAPSFHDCWFFLPSSVFAPDNVAKLLGYLAGLILLAEWLPPRISTRRAPRDRAVMLAALALAAIPWFGWLDLRGPGIRLLPVRLAATALLWGFLLVNLGLPCVDRAVQSRGWIGRMLEWTYPASDAVCFAWHRRRLGRRRLWLPVLVLVAGLGAGAWRQAALVRGSAVAARLPVTVYDPRQVAADGSGAWIADAVSRYDAGLWRYDAGAGDARPALRAADLRSFIVDGGAAYLYDGFDHTVSKVDLATRDVAWRVPLPEPSGRIDLLAAPGLIYAAGDAGYLLVVDRAGQRKAARAFPYAIRYPQALPDGRLAFVAPEQGIIRITGPRPSDDDAIALPGPAGTLRSTPDGIPVITGLAYVEPLHALYVATLWGEILRYDLSARAWQPSLRTGIGLTVMAADGLRGLLWLYHAPRGLVEAVDLAGRRVTAARTSTFGTTLSPDPSGARVFLSARGPGFTSLPKPGAVYEVADEPKS